jgi:hypothetical protein
MPKQDYAELRALGRGIIKFGRWSVHLAKWIDKRIEKHYAG